MNQGQAIQVINDLIPEIGRTKDPEGVLLKYAADNNLSPAQLERLGQVFNTAKTISYMEKSASRGGSFSLVDTDALLAGYMELDHEPADGMSKQASSKGSVTPAHNPFKLPNMWQVAEGRTKQASPTASTFDLNAVQAEIVKMSNALEVELREDVEYYEGLLDLHDQSRKDIYDNLEKLAYEVYQKGPETFAALERDSLAAFNKNAYALDHLAMTLDSPRYGSCYKRADQVKLASVKVVSDSTGLLDLLTRIEEDISVHLETKDQILTKLAAGGFEISPEQLSKLDALRAQFGGLRSPDEELELPFGETPDPNQPELPGIDETLPENADETPDISPEEFFGDDFAEKFNQQGAPFRTYTAGPGIEPPSSTRNTGSKRVDTAPYEFGAESEKQRARRLFQQALERRDDQHSQYTSNVLERMRMVAEEEAKQKANAKKEDPHPTLTKLLAKYDEAAGKVRGVVDESYKNKTQWLKGKFTAKPTHDKARALRDGVQQDIRRAVTLQKYLTKDPVLASSDPERVVSLYNTLYKANPEMMSDENTMLAALREAVQYDGVMPHTYEQFVTTGKNREQQTKDELANRETRYKI